MIRFGACNPNGMVAPTLKYSHNSDGIGGWNGGRWETLSEGGKGDEALYTFLFCLGDEWGGFEGSECLDSWL